jgi:predicted methyltransferase MtxX (methanogen marker protein 4)
MLTLAVVMHAGIGLLMGMGAFGAAMLTGCLAFVDASRVRAVAGNAADGLGGPART